MLMQAAKRSGGLPALRSAFPSSHLRTTALAEIGRRSFSSPGKGPEGSGEGAAFSRFANRFKGDGSTKEEVFEPPPPEEETVDKVGGSKSKSGARTQTHAGSKYHNSYSDNASSNGSSNTNNSSSNNTNSTNNNTNNTNSTNKNSSSKNCHKNACGLTPEDKRNLLRLGVGIGLCVLAAAVGSDHFKM